LELAFRICRQLAVSSNRSKPLTRARLAAPRRQHFSGTVTSKPAANGLRNVLNFQRVGSQRYFDAAGFPVRTPGLEANGGKQKTAGK
jgi:hypothetical protein